jgi:hypothetical protein
MSEDTIFTTCAKSYDAQTDLTGLLQCLSETQELVGSKQNAFGVHTEGGIAARGGFIIRLPEVLT